MKIRAKSRFAAHFQNKIQAVKSPGYLYHGIGDQGFQIMQTTRFDAFRASDIC